MWCGERSSSASTCSFSFSGILSSVWRPGLSREQSMCVYIRSCVISICHATSGRDSLPNYPSQSQQVPYLTYCEKRPAIQFLQRAWYSYSNLWPLMQIGFLILLWTIAFGCLFFSWHHMLHSMLVNMSWSRTWPVRSGSAIMTFTATLLDYHISYIEVKVSYAFLNIDRKECKSWNTRVINNTF